MYNFFPFHFLFLETEKTPLYFSPCLFSQFPNLDIIYEKALNLAWISDAILLTSAQNTQKYIRSKSPLFILLKQKVKYSRTSRKPPPKMKRLSGRLRELVAYKNGTTGGLFREEVQTHQLQHLLYGRYLLQAMSKLRQL